MEKKKIDTITSKADKYLQQGRLRDALQLLRGLSEGGMQWEISDKLSQIAKNYAYMLHYLTDGLADPDRDKIYNNLVLDTYAAADSLTRRLMFNDSPAPYFSTLRNLSIRPRNLATVIAEYRNLDLHRDNIVEQITSGASPTDPRMVERAERDIFNYLWTAYPLNSDDLDALFDLLDNADSPLRVKQLAVSALVLGAIEFYDSARIMALMNIYGNDNYDVALSSVAMVGFLLALFRFHNRPMPEALVDRLKILADAPKWQSDVKTAFMELIRTRDTERINKTMRDDIIPGMMKMRPDIMQKIEEGIFEPENPTENPEWEDMLKKSGVADKIKELSELQQQGADVFMSTFSHLKSFPFFNEVANWFMPFDADHSEVVAVNMPPMVMSLLKKMPILCDSDKYSFALSLAAVPDSQRKMMMSQFEAQNGQQLEEMMAAEAAMVQVERRTIMSAFLQNLYRFLFLSRGKNYFYNPFDQGVNLLKVDALASYINDPETVEVVAEFFFSGGYWKDALAAFKTLDELSDPNAQVFQKIGYCYEKLGDSDKALAYYHQAELFDSDSRWLLRRLGANYRKKGDFHQAVGYFKRVADLEPDNLDAVMTLGFVMLQDKDYRGALDQFYKVEFLEPEGSRALRPLAWTLFLTGDFDGAARYYQRIIYDNPTANDYLNMGHVAMARQAYKEAVNFYKLSMNTGGNDPEKLIVSIRNDEKALSHAGVSDRTLALVIDALLYSL